MSDTSAKPEPRSYYCRYCDQYLTQQEKLAGECKVRLTRAVEDYVAVTALLPCELVDADAHRKGAR